MVMTTLIVFFLFNNTEQNKRRFYLICIGFCCFLLGDILLILFKIQSLYITGLFSFIAGKLFYAFHFSNQRDFKLRRLIPFLLICFIYMVVILNLIYNNLGMFFFPTLIYLFASMVLALFAYLRKDDVNYTSYILVLLGVLTFVICDTIGVLQSFYDENLPYHEITVMLFYGISQYLIVLGIVKEYN